MWTAFWGFFTCSLSAFGIMLGLAPEYVGLRPWFFWSGIITGITALVIFLWPLCSATNRAKAFASVRHFLEWIKKLDPSHLIWIGVVGCCLFGMVAFAGLLLQLKSPLKDAALSPPSNEETSPVIAYPQEWRAVVLGAPYPPTIDAKNVENFRGQGNYTIGTGTLAKIEGGKNIDISGNYSDFADQREITLSDFRDSMLASLGNKELREKAIAFAQNLRDFQFEKQKNDPSYRRDFPAMNLTPEQRHEAFQKTVNESRDYSAQTAYGISIDNSETKR